MKITARRFLGFLNGFLILLIIAFSLAIPMPASANIVVSQWSPMSSGSSVYLWDAWGSSGSDVFVVGAGGTILHYNGSAWSTMTSNTGSTLYGVWGSSGSDVFAVGDGGTILHYDGSTWSSMTSPVTGYIFDIWGFAHNNIYAVGGHGGSGTQYGTIIHFDGTSWSTMVDSIAVPWLFQVWGSSAGDIFAVGDSGTILHSTGGLPWTVMGSGTSDNIYGLWGFSSSDVFATTYFGTMLHYNGSSWSSSACPATMARIWGSSNKDLYGAGTTSNPIVHYDGSAWSQSLSTWPNNLEGVWGICANDIFVVGDQGNILHYGTGCPPAVTTQDATNITLTSATFNGGLTSLGSCGTALVSFQYGSASGQYDSETPAQTMSNTGSFSSDVVLGNPYAARTVYYRAKASCYCCTAHGTEISFTKPQLPSQSPRGSAAPPLPAPPVTLSNVTVKTASLSASRVSPGTPVTVNASVVNSGTANGSSLIKLYVNGQEETGQGVNIESGKTTALTFTVSRNKPGTYTVYVGGTQAGSFVVDQFADANMVLYASIAFIFIVLVAGGYVLWRRRQ